MYSGFFGQRGDAPTERQPVLGKPASKRCLLSFFLNVSVPFTDGYRYFCFPLAKWQHN
jgi:hypothetical protein